MQDGLNSLLSANDFEISPMLAKLIEQIEALFQADPDSRCLIFMEKRKQCALLADILKRRTKRETCHLTGKASSQVIRFYKY
jgi:ERCC4-related helicase